MVTNEIASEGPAPRKSSLWKAAAAQVRLIRALVLRDMMTQYAESRIGYIWKIILPVLAVVIFYAIRNFRGSAAISPYFPLGIMMITGFPLWMVFRDTYSHVLSSTDRNDPLLVVPHVTILDMIISRAVAETVSNSLFFIVLTVGGSILFNFPPERPAEILILFLISGWLGGALGLLMCPVHRMFPMATQILNMFMRIGMWISGVIFCMRQMPPSVWPYLSWNPLMHLTEGVRECWTSNYDSPIFSLTYVLGCCFTMTALGLLLERGSRRFMGP
jgi:capsular polysaccharide transport system permease protein